MINGDLNQFLEILSYGGELEFQYRDKIFFLQGWTKNGIRYMVLDELNTEVLEDYIWQCKKENMQECANAFLNEKLWDGKTFLEVEKEIIWLD